MVYGGFKDLTRRTTSDKKLRDKAFNIAKNQEYDGYHKRFDKKTSGEAIKNEVISNKVLEEQLFQISTIISRTRISN